MIIQSQWGQLVWVVTVTARINSQSDLSWACLCFRREIKSVKTPAISRPGPGQLLAAIETRRNEQEVQKLSKWLMRTGPSQHREWKISTRGGGESRWRQSRWGSPHIRPATVRSSTPSPQTTTERTGRSSINIISLVSQYNSVTMRELDLQKVSPQTNNSRIKHLNILWYSSFDNWAHGAARVSSVYVTIEQR